MHLDKTLLRGPANILETDKFSKINITDSTFVSGCPKTNSRLSLGPKVDCQLVTETKNSNLDISLEEAVKSWGRRPTAIRRGAPN